MKEQLSLPDETGIYSLITKDIEVAVVPMHLEKNSLPERGIFAFTYSVSIKNFSTENVQLLERHWIVKSAGKQVAEVVGPGVVGVQPVLEHGTTFEYASNVVIHDAFGSMEGSYTFRTESGNYFEVSIPRFDLLYPLTIH